MYTKTPRKENGEWISAEEENRGKNNKEKAIVALVTAAAVPIITKICKGIIEFFNFTEEKQATREAIICKKVESRKLRSN